MQANIKNIFDKLKNLTTRILNVENKKIEITTGVEYATNEYIDGKQVFRKRIDCGTLPNNATKSIETGLDNVVIIKPPKGYFSEATHFSIFPLPYITGYLAGNVAMYVNPYGRQIKIVTKEDKTAYTECFVELYYIKN